MEKTLAVGVGRVVGLQVPLRGPSTAPAASEALFLLQRLRRSRWSEAIFPGGTPTRHARRLLGVPVVRVSRLASAVAEPARHRGVVAVLSVCGQRIG